MYSAQEAQAQLEAARQQVLAAKEMADKAEADAAAQAARSKAIEERKEKERERMSRAADREAEREREKWAARATRIEQLKAQIQEAWASNSEKDALVQEMMTDMKLIQAARKAEKTQCIKEEQAKCAVHVQELREQV